MKLRLELVVCVAIVVVFSVLGNGCAGTSVRPWDRDLLSEKKMQYNPHPMVHAVDEHIYFSKEGSTGGDEVGGGGCGCN